MYGTKEITHFTPMESLLTIERRCECGRLLFKGLVLKDLLEVKCHRCKKMHYFPGVDVVDGSRRFILLTDLEGIIVNASASIKRHLGVSVSDIFKTNIQSLFAKKDDARADTTIAVESAKHPYLRFDGSFKTKDHNILSTNISYRYLKRDKSRDFILRVIDCLPAVHESELADIGFNASDICDFTAETNGRGVILYVDNRVKELLGFFPEDMVAHQVSEFESPEEHALRRKNRALLGDRQITFRSKKFIMLRKDGQKVSFDVYSTPFYDQSGEFMGYRNMLWLNDMSQSS